MSMTDMAGRTESGDASTTPATWLSEEASSSPAYMMAAGASFLDAGWTNETTDPWRSDPLDFVVNRTLNASMDSVNVAAPMRHLSFTTEVVLTVSYAVGIAGNLAALVILVRGGKRAHRNRRHSLMLRCLASNDLLALLGMLLMMEAQLRLPPAVSNSRFFCALRVVWRLFGLGSGSVALVMAAERWLALTRPFLYQKRVTYNTVRRAIFTLWGCVLLLVLLPLAGFGLYYDPHSNRRCLRYRRATEPLDVAYAYVYFTVGMLLICSIVCCNLLVMRHLCHGQASWGRSRARCWGWSSRSASCGPVTLGDTEQGLLRAVYRPTLEKTPPSRQPSIIRRFSRASSRMRFRLQHTESVDSATYEETAFAKLMALLCVLFVICWLPQMMAIPLTQLWPDWVAGKRFTRVADFSLLLHFTLDPFVYVLQRCTRRHRRYTAPPPPPASILGPGPVAATQLPEARTPLRVKSLCATVCGALGICSCSGRDVSDHSLTHYNSSGTAVPRNPLSSVAL